MESESTLPAELRQLGYDVTEIGETERILPAAIVEQFTIGARGELEPATAEFVTSDRADANARRHRQGAAICVNRRGVPTPIGKLNY
jgi:hypothetical protein